MKAGLWLVGVIVLVALLEFFPRAGGALLLVLVAYLAITVMKKGVV